MEKEEDRTGKNLKTIFHRYDILQTRMEKKEALDDEELAELEAWLWVIDVLIPKVIRYLK